MSLFGRKKEKNNCCEGCSCNAKNNQKTESAPMKGARVKILGSGCAKCHALEAATKAALEQLGMDTAIDHVTDFSQIAAYGVMSTPALVVDGKVVSYGKVLKTPEVVSILQKL
ncbi:MAG: Redox-active disulfide protein 2 [Oscillospiraceae bacterium]